MKLYQGKIPAIAEEIVRSLTAAGDIEVTDAKEAQLDVESVLREYLRMDREITDDEKKQARDFFAKIKIYQKEYEDKAKAGQLNKDFQDKVGLEIKLQQAQFLMGLYSKGLADKVKATDDDIAKYISEHPDLDPKDKKARAEDILNRAKKLSLSESLWSTRTSP